MTWDILSYPLMAAAVVALAAQASAEQASKVDAQANVYTNDVKTHPSRGDVRMIDGAKARLVTTADGVWASLDTRELTPGNAYTLWFVVINDPEACENTPCKGSDVLELSDRTQSDVGYGDGLIAGPEGTGQFVTYRSVGDLPQAWIGNGLQRPQRAEIHLVVHDHGPLIDGMAQNMIATYRGGCADDSLPDTDPATARADGKPGPNACKRVQGVTFMQSEAQTAMQ